MIFKYAGIETNNQYNVQMKEDNRNINAGIDVCMSTLHKHGMVLMLLLLQLQHLLNYEKSNLHTIAKQNDQDRMIPLYRF